MKSHCRAWPAYRQWLPEVSTALVSAFLAACLKTTLRSPLECVRNIEATGYFVVNLATWSLRDQVDTTAVPAPRGIDKFGFVCLLFAL